MQCFWPFLMAFLFGIGSSTHLLDISNIFLNTAFKGFLAVLHQFIYICQKQKVKKENKRHAGCPLPVSLHLPAATLYRGSAPVQPDGRVCTATRRARRDTTARAAARSAPVATEPTATASVAPASALLDS